jgi:putative cell wall-binding protein
MSENELEESKQGSVPEEDLVQFKRAYRLTLNSMAILVKEANGHQNKLNTATTTPKRNLYKNKFDKTKVKFQDELKRLVQLEHILKTNGVDVKEVEKEPVASAEDQIKDFDTGDTE